MKDSKTVTPRNRRATQARWGEATLTPEEQHRMRREALFATAARAFNESGYYNTTLDEVAKRLNVSKPTLYYYVKDKEDILVECNRIAFQHMKDVLDEVEVGTQTGREKLTHFLSRYTALMTNHFGACLIRTGLKPLKPESRAKQRVLADQLDKALQRIVKQGIEDGSIRPCDPKVVSYAIFGGFNGIANWYREDGELKPENIYSGFLDVFLNGLMPAETAPVRPKTRPPKK